MLHAISPWDDLQDYLKNEKDAKTLREECWIRDNFTLMLDISREALSHLQGVLDEDGTLCHRKDFDDDLEDFRKYRYRTFQNMLVQLYLEYDGSDSLAAFTRLTGEEFPVKAAFTFHPCGSIDDILHARDVIVHIANILQSNRMSFAIAYPPSVSGR